MTEVHISCETLNMGRGRLSSWTPFLAAGFAPHWGKAPWTFLYEIPDKHSRLAEQLVNGTCIPYGHWYLRSVNLHTSKEKKGIIVANSMMSSSWPNLQCQKFRVWLRGSGVTPSYTAARPTWLESIITKHCDKGVEWTAPCFNEAPSLLSGQGAGQDIFASFCVNCSYCWAGCQINVEVSDQWPYRF